MANRHLARTLAMQCLYEWDMTGQNMRELPRIEKHLRDEFAADFDDGGYVKETLAGVFSHLEDIDATLQRFAPEWPLASMGAVDRNILRVGLFELTFTENIPSKVAINEAIEVAKTFGGEASGRFVNGILGAVYKDRVGRGVIKASDAPKTKRD